MASHDVFKIGRTHKNIACRVQLTQGAQYAHWHCRCLSSDQDLTWATRSRPATANLKNSLHSHSTVNTAVQQLQVLAFTDHRRKADLAGEPHNLQISCLDSGFAAQSTTKTWRKGLAQGYAGRRNGCPCSPAQQWRRPDAALHSVAEATVAHSTHQPCLEGQALKTSINPGGRTQRSASSEVANRNVLHPWCTSPPQRRCSA